MVNTEESSVLLWFDIYRIDHHVVIISHVWESKCCTFHNHNSQICRLSATSMISLVSHTEETSPEADDDNMAAATQVIPIYVEFYTFFAPRDKLNTENLK